MAFVRAVVTSLHQVRNVGGTVVGIRFVADIYDDTTTEVESFSYGIRDDEFTSLPTGTAAKKAALVAIVKRETHIAFDKWVFERAIRPAAPIVRDIVGDLDTNEITTFNGEAPPLP